MINSRSWASVLFSAIINFRRQRRWDVCYAELDRIKVKLAKIKKGSIIAMFTKKNTERHFLAVVLWREERESDTFQQKPTKNDSRWRRHEEDPRMACQNKPGKSSGIFRFLLQNRGTPVFVCTFSLFFPLSVLIFLSFSQRRRRSLETQRDVRWKRQHQLFRSAARPPKVLLSPRHQ